MQLNSTQDDASKAQARLAADDEHRRTQATTIAEGEQAKIALHRKLRQRITDAIGDRALFPASFTTTLGYSPPADGTTDWIAAATALIAYAITAPRSTHHRRALAWTARDPRPLAAAVSPQAN